MMEAVLKVLKEKLVYIDGQIAYDDRSIANLRVSIDHHKTSLELHHAVRDSFVAAIAKLQAEPGAKR